MAGLMTGCEPDPPQDAWLPSNSQEVIWDGQRNRFWYKAGFANGRREHDLTAAVADMPKKKDVGRASKVRKTFLRILHRAEKKGLTLRKVHAKLSPEDAKKIRRQVNASFFCWAHQWRRSGGLCSGPGRATAVAVSVAR